MLSSTRGAWAHALGGGTENFHSQTFAVALRVFGQGFDFSEDSLAGRPGRDESIQSIIHGIAPRGCAGQNTVYISKNRPKQFLPPGLAGDSLLILLNRLFPIEGPE